VTRDRLKSRKRSPNTPTSDLGVWVRIGHLRGYRTALNQLSNPGTASKRENAPMCPRFLTAVGSPLYASLTTHGTAELLTGLKEYAKNIAAAFGPTADRVLAVN
jgi:hypothetical protein